MVRKRRVSGAKRDLAKASVGCRDPNEIPNPATRPGPHQEMIQHFHSVLQAAADRPVYVLEMAMAIGASLPVLSVCCEEQLGMGPEKYLLLRRLHLVKRALCAANPAATTVPDMATRHGFWQFSQFSGLYKSVFGELPSDTLRRTPNSSKNDNNDQFQRQTR
jgi:transcriptional regulator GlxA family with amidase domain